MRILVAGGAGFIGSNFIRYLLGAHGGWSVVNVDKLTYAGNLANLEDMAGEPRYRFHRADICDAAGIARIFAEEKPEAVVNFAAETHVDRSIDVPVAPSEPYTSSPGTCRSRPTRCTARWGRRGTSPRSLP